MADTGTTPTEAAAQQDTGMPPRPGMRITPPFGYDEVVPLQRNDRVLLPHGSTPGFCRSINALAVSFSEFVVAGRDYPIVFASGDGGATFAPVIVLGLAEGQNLFVDAAGEWDGAAYLPAFVRRYPFCITKVYADGKPQSERLVCIARSYLDAQGLSLFDATGAATPQWAQMEQLLSEYERDLDLTAQMCSIIARLGLFSPFRFQVVQGDTPAITMEGMYRIDEQKFQDLKPTSHKALVTKGIMGRIYAHLHSLERFSALYQRTLARAAEDQKARLASHQR
jgi:hypothetical protein